MDTKNAGWADKPQVQKRIRWSIYAVCIGLFAADFIVHRHIYIEAENIPAFYALYGFTALVGVVLAAKGLRRLVKRDEGYYEQ